MNRDTRTLSMGTWTLFFLLGWVPIGSTRPQPSTSPTVPPVGAGAVRIEVRADRRTGTVEPLWSFFGYDEANYTFTEDGKELLGRIAELEPRPSHIRTHHLLTSGDGTAWLKWSSSGAYREDERGPPLHDWAILDRIFDTLHERGLKPFVEIGFMPEALSLRPENYTPPRVTRGRPRGAVGGGAFQPPRDYRKWEAFIEAWARHCSRRYGEAEAESWFWELWNEPNISYWKGTTEEYLRLYDHTAAAVKRALPGARFGGPHVTNPTSRSSEPFLRQFIEHCLRGRNAVTGKVGAPLDFLAFHAKGGTALVDGHVRMNLGNHLRVIDRGLEIIASYPELKGKPVVIGESDPDGCAACSETFYPQNGYRNGSQYASYTAATFLREQDLAERHGVNLVGALTWAFTFPDQPWFDGFRTLATNGVVKPVFNVFRMFSLLERERIVVDIPGRRGLDDLMASSVREGPDIDAFASRGERAITVLIWHYHDDGVPGADVPVELLLSGLPGPRKARFSHHRIDDDHSNAHTAWLAMGSPQEPTTEQRAALERASALAALQAKKPVEIRDGKVDLRFSLPRQSVSLIRLEW